MIHEAAAWNADCDLPSAATLAIRRPFPPFPETGRFGTKSVCSFCTWRVGICDVHRWIYACTSNRYPDVPRRAFSWVHPLPTKIWISTRGALRHNL